MFKWDERVRNYMFSEVLLKAKCWVIANDIGVNEGDIVLKGINA